MNKRFSDYLSSLTPRRRDLAQEAVAEYLKGESDISEEIKSGMKVYNLCRDMSLLDVEHFDIILLNIRHKLIKRVNLFVGGLTETTIDIRLVIRECVMNNAVSFIAVHNHPSGEISPSSADDNLTKLMRDAANLMNLHLIDHVIIGYDNYYSYHENGRM